MHLPMQETRGIRQEQRLEVLLQMPLNCKAWKGARGSLGQIQSSGQLILVAKHWCTTCCSM